MVFTNGCFDVIHAGHVHILRTAVTLGDILVVGVNTDASVRRLKGRGRPVNPLEERMLVLSEFRSVDVVVPFHEDTPLQLVRELQPDVIVKGGDYSPEEVAGGEFVISRGGRVEIVPLVPGCSSTATLKALSGGEHLDPEAFSE